MENPPKLQNNQNPPAITTSSSSSSNSNGHHHHLHHPPPLTPTSTTPRPITRSEPTNPYPTTFVQADTASFKQVVQMLTGSSETARSAASHRPDPQRNPIPPVKPGPMKNTASSKLYERRNSLRNSFKISPLVPGFGNSSGYSPRTPDPTRLTDPQIVSPSVLDFPALALSPVTPLIPDPFNRSPNCTRPVSSNLNTVAEENAIAKKSFYLHPSPARDSEPRLLPLFPVTSPRASGSSSA